MKDILGYVDLSHVLCRLNVDLSLTKYVNLRLLNCVLLCRF